MATRSDSPPRPTPKASPATLTVAVTTYRDAPLLYQCLQSVRRVYPSARLVAIADGWDHPAVRAIADRHGAECHYGERLFPLAKGTAMWRRYFALYRQQPTDYLFRIDTDTLFHRPLTDLPQGLCYFGSLQEMEVLDRTQKVPFVQGGCIGFPAETVKTIWSSGMLDDQATNEHPHTTWGVGFSRYMPDRGLISVDKMMGYIAYRLGISAVRHEDIYSHWYVNKGNARPRHFAVTHPHKLPDCRSEIALDEQGTGAAPATLRCRDDLTTPIDPAWTGQFAQPLVPPGVDWPAAGLSQPTVMAGGERGIPAANTVVLIWDDDTWHAVRHLCNLQRSQRRASSGLYLLAQGNGVTTLWYRAQGACRSEREIARIACSVRTVVERSGARLVLSAGPASGTRPQDAFGTVNITNTARFDLVAAAAESACNRQTYTNAWTPCALQPARLEPFLCHLPTPPPGLSALAAQIPDYTTADLANPLLQSTDRPRIAILDIAALTTNGPQVADDRGSHDHFSCIEPVAAAVAMACAADGCAFGFAHAIADPVQNSALPQPVRQQWGGLLRHAYRRPACFNAALAAWAVASAP